MKRNKYLLLVPLLIAVMAMIALDAQSARKKARDDISGSGTITAYDADRSVTKTLMDKTLLRDIKGVFPDVILGHIIVGAFAAAGGQSESGDIGELDSGFVTVYTGWGARKIALITDTCTSLPCTSVVTFFADIADTTGGVQYLADSWMEHIWLDVSGSDSTGDGDTIAADVSWNFRFLYME